MNEALSFTNSHVQQLRRLLRRRSVRSADGLWAVEGAVLIGEAVAAGWNVEAEFVDVDAEPVTNAPIYRLASGVVDRVATTERAQPNLAIVGPPTPDDTSRVLDDASFVVVCDRLNDPGNLGTILRSAEASGAQAVVLTKGSVDPGNPKVIRSSAGAVFHIPTVTAELHDLASAGFDLIGTSSHLGVNHYELDWQGRIALAVGNEAHGLDDAAEVTKWVKIEHHGRAESLNVAMAATVLLFEAARQRAG